MVRISFLIARMSRKFIQALLVPICLIAWVRPFHQHFTVSLNQHSFEKKLFGRKQLQFHFHSCAIYKQFQYHLDYQPRNAHVFAVFFLYFASSFLMAFHPRLPLRDFQTQRMDMNQSGGLRIIVFENHCNLWNAFDCHKPIWWTSHHCCNKVSKISFVNDNNLFFLTT